MAVLRNRRQPALKLSCCVVIANRKLLVVRDNKPWRNLIIVFTSCVDVWMLFSNLPQPKRSTCLCIVESLRSLDWFLQIKQPVSTILQFFSWTGTLVSLKGCNQSSSSSRFKEPPTAPCVFDQTRFSLCSYSSASLLRDNTLAQTDLLAHSVSSLCIGS